MNFIVKRVIIINYINRLYHFITAIYLIKLFRKQDYIIK